MTNYQKQKAQARAKAIEWQLDLDNQSYSQGEFADWSDYFTKLGKRYGLTQEFRENGII